MKWLISQIGCNIYTSLAGCRTIIGNAILKWKYHIASIDDFLTERVLICTPILNIGLSIINWILEHLIENALGRLTKTGNALSNFK